MPDDDCATWRSYYDGDSMCNIPCPACSPRHHPCESQLLQHYRHTDHTHCRNNSHCVVFSLRNIKGANFRSVDARDLHNLQRIRHSHRNDRLRWMRSDDP